MSFKELKINEQILRALTKEGYTIPTPIQAKAIPELLKGKDLMGIAQTGTGKTAAFVVPILQRMCAEPKQCAPKFPRVLVLAPTRELAAQIDQSFATYGKFLKIRHTVIFGGVGQMPQVKTISRGVDVLVATPGRLLDLMNQGHVHLKHVEFFVLDEADRMLDMGFIHDVRKIVARLPSRRQSLFFSATMPSQVAKLASTLLLNPVRVQVAPQATTVELVEQHVFFVDQENKDKLLISLLQQQHLTSVLIFTRTKHRANKVAKLLASKGIKADAIHGNKSQSARTKAMGQFRSGVLQVLVATDIAARGIDIDNISHVINYDLPNEAESYVHRIGRTARAGAKGTAYSFCAADERDFLRDVEKLTRMQITVKEHKYHSARAKDATGKSARPAPKQQRGQRSNRSPRRRSFSRRR
ncbi:MAG: DEAD/DEAH box helicase [Nanoarchaeota archaeon]|nr:DEAD/DEAH box helicase [Nanoarchaeota archaeon]